MPTRPFACQECNDQPQEGFSVFEAVNDWLIAFPEKNLVHIHLGQSVQTEKISMEEAHFHYQWVMDLVKKYPKKKFFFVVDVGNKDNSEIMPAGARKILQKIITHPQLPKGAAYGLTWAWRMVGNFLIFIGADINFVETEEQAREAYKKWKKTYRGE